MMVDSKQLTAQAQCTAKGWTWQNGVCKSPRQIEEEKKREEIKKSSYIPPTESRAPEPFLKEPTAPFKVEPKTSQAYPNQQPIQTPEFDEAGRPTDIPMGVPLTPEESQRLSGAAEFEASKQGGLSAAEGIVAKQAAQARGEQLQQLLLEAGIPNQLAPTVEAGIDWSQALTAGLGASASYAAGGAALGAVGSGGLSSVPLAVAGGVGGFISGILGNIKSQQQGEIGAANVELTQGRTAMRQYAMFASRDPASADEYMRGYQATLTRMHQARRQIKAETSGNLNNWMDDGRKDLANFDSFLSKGGLAQIYLIKLQISLDTGVPLSIIGDELV